MDANPHGPIDFESRVFLLAWCIVAALAATALLRRHTLRPLPKILYPWILFVCALWAAGPPLFGIVFY